MPSQILLEISSVTEFDMTGGSVGAELGNFCFGLFTWWKDPTAIKPHTTKGGHVCIMLHQIH